MVFMVGKGGLSVTRQGACTFSGCLFPPRNKRSIAIFNPGLLARETGRTPVLGGLPLKRSQDI